MIYTSAANTAPSGMTGRNLFGQVDGTENPRGPDEIRATLIGDGATALRQIRAIGNDLSLDPGIGNCGKQGQWVPVGVGLPSLRIGGLTIGGSSS